MAAEKIPDVSKKLARHARRVEAAITREISDFLADVLANDPKFISDAMIIQSRSNVGRIINEFGSFAKQWANKDLTDYYYRQVAEADREMREYGIDIAEFITTPASRDALLNRGLKVIRTEFSTRIKDLLSIVARKSFDEYSRVQRETALYGFKETDNVKHAIRNLREEFKTRGVRPFVDRAGREWRMDNYTDMLGRTVTAQARLRAKEMEFLAHGQNLVRISSHWPTCDMCAPWNDVIVALDEPTEQYPYTLEDARAEGLFHPRCLHTITLFLEGFSEPGQEEPDFSEEAKEKNKEARAAMRELMEKQLEEEREKRRLRYWAKKAVNSDAERGFLNDLKDIFFQDKPKILPHDPEWRDNIAKLLKKGFVDDLDYIAVGGIAYNELTSVVYRTRRINMPNALVKKLSSVKDFGGEINFHPDSDTKAQRYVERAAKLLPERFINIINQHPKRLLTAEITKERGSYRSADHVVKIDSGKLKTALHELGHAAERNSKVLEAEKTFFDRRTESEEARPLNDLIAGWRYRKNEKAKEDKFLHPYMGKVYDDGKAYEILSEGLEYVYYNRDNIWYHDPEYVKFILGLLLGG